MKEALSSFDVAATVAELQRYVGWRIDKAYHPTRDHLVLAVKGVGEGKEFIHFVVGKWLFSSKASSEMPQQPSDFAMMLRKRITNAKIGSIRQPGFERMVVLRLEKDGSYELVLELFGEGNVVLVRDGTIVQPLISHTWKHRNVRARKEFEYPPPVPDPSGISADDLMALMKASDADVVRTLATKLNLGGTYSEETCHRSGVARSAPAKDVTLSDAGRILSEIRSMLADASQRPAGYLMSKSSQPEDVTPFRMESYASLEVVEYPSFSEAVERYISDKPRKKERVKTSDDEKEKGKLKRRIAQQEAAVIALQDEIREGQMTGDALFANYAAVSEVIRAAQNRLSKGVDLDEIPGFVSYDPKKSEMILKRGHLILRLNVKGSVETNAERYYEDAKKARKKLAGLLEVLAASKEEMADRTDRETAEREKVRHKPTKKFWFERYRWFISSEGAVVLGGKDARSNDMLVKKHLDAGDRYAHADMHGAPSIVVKMREGATDVTLREACEFAVATSKAWNAKIGSAAGYWVLPEQVSKTPQSGEYLAKGAFVIRGKRNYSDKIDIKLGIGLVEHEGERKVMGGPESAVKSLSQRFVILRPGEMDKDLLAKILSDRFEVPIEEVQAVMPPGDVDVVETAGIDLGSLNRG